MAVLAFLLFVLLPHASQANPSADRLLLVAAISFVMFGLLVMLLYILFALRSQWVPQALKKRWASRIFIGSIYTMPVFW